MSRASFIGVPEDVWNFHIGGYQVCAKWLKVMADIDRFVYDLYGLTPAEIKIVEEATGK